MRKTDTIIDIVSDARNEVEVMLTAWQTQGQGNGGLFRPRFSSDTPKSDASSEFFIGDLEQSQELPGRSQSQVRFVVSDATDGNYRDEEPVEIKRTKRSRLNHDGNPGRGSGSQHFEIA